MKNDILNTIILAALFLALFGVAEILYHYAKIKAETTRKIVHIGTGFLTLLFPIMLSNYLPVLFLCFVFAVILIVSIQFNFLPSINAIKRESVGSLAYPVSVFGCYLVYTHFNYQLIYFYLPILILAICDPLAALSGKKWPVGIYKVGKENKTMLGSFAFLLSACVIIIITSFLLNKNVSLGRIALRAIIIAPIAAAAEAFSKKGYDNISIPVSVLACLFITEQMI